VMSLEPGEDIGLEVHEDRDQFLRIEHGHARVELGPSEHNVDETHDVEDDWAVIVPAGTWHNVVNTGDDKLKLYSLYSPPEHPDGTVHRNKARRPGSRARLALAVSVTRERPGGGQVAVLRTGGEREIASSGEDGAFRVVLSGGCSL